LFELFWFFLRRLLPNIVSANKMVVVGLFF
jgi:hypothetical protein